jgi:hypothetical protein
MLRQSLKGVPARWQRLPWLGSTLRGGRKRLRSRIGWRWRAPSRLLGLRLDHRVGLRDRGRTFGDHGSELIGGRAGRLAERPDPGEIFLRPGDRAFRDQRFTLPLSRP